MIKLVKLCKLSNNRGLNELKLEEIPLMLEAYIKGSNSLFHEDAFGEFWSIDISDPQLAKIRDVIKKRVFITPESEDDWGDFNEREMEQIADEIVRGTFEC